LFLLQSTNFCFAIAKLEVRFDICKQKRIFFQKNVDFFKFGHEIYQYLTPDDVIMDKIFVDDCAFKLFKFNSKFGYRIEDC